jgi:hypothetical protein
MSDEVTVISRTSWFGRIGKAIVGVGIGLVMMLVAFPLLWWNEGRAVHRARSLEEGATIVVHVPIDRVDAANDGRLVHLNGLATTENTVMDPDFGIAAKVIRLERKAETYQWKEEKHSKKHKKLGGSEETRTTYTYSKVWSRTHIDSSDFNSPSGHANPPSLAWESKTITADRVTLGAFVLPSELVEKIGHARLRPIGDEDTPNLRAPGFTVEGNLFYKGRNPSDPQVGDVRVTFDVVEPRNVSIVAQQSGGTFRTYEAKAGSGILLLEEGDLAAAEMFKAAEAANVRTTWLVRLGGFVLMFIGLVLILRPLSVLASVIPALGSVVGAGTGFLSFVIALVLALATMALAWIAYRPLIGGSLLALVVGMLYLAIRGRRKKTMVVPPPIPNAH